MSSEITQEAIFSWAAGEDVAEVLSTEFPDISPSTQEKIFAAVRRDRIDQVRTALGVAVLELADEAESSYEANKIRSIVGMPSEIISPVTILYPYEPEFYQHRRNKHEGLRIVSDLVDESLPDLPESRRTRIISFLYPSEAGYAKTNQVAGVKLHERGITFDSNKLAIDSFKKVKGLGENLGNDVLMFIHYHTQSK